MGKGSLRAHRNGQPKTRNHVAVVAQFRNSAGTMGGGKATRNKRERQTVKRNLRAGRFDDYDA